MSRPPSREPGIQMHSRTENSRPRRDAHPQEERSSFPSPGKQPSTWALKWGDGGESTPRSSVLECGPRHPGHTQATQARLGRGCISSSAQSPAGIRADRALLCLRGRRTRETGVSGLFSAPTWKVVLLLLVCRQPHRRLLSPRDVHRGSRPPFLSELEALANQRTPFEGSAAARGGWARLQRSGLTFLFLLLSSGGRWSGPNDFFLPGMYRSAVDAATRRHASTRRPHPCSLRGC